MHASVFVCVYVSVRGLKKKCQFLLIRMSCAFSRSLPHPSHSQYSLCRCLSCICYNNWLRSTLQSSFVAFTVRISLYKNGEYIFFFASLYTFDVVLLLLLLLLIPVPPVISFENKK